LFVAGVQELKKWREEAEVFKARKRQHSECGRLGVDENSRSLLSLFLFESQLNQPLKDNSDGMGTLVSCGIDIATPLVNSLYCIYFGFSHNFVSLSPSFFPRLQPLSERLLLSWTFVMVCAHLSVPMWTQCKLHQTRQSLRFSKLPRFQTCEASKRTFFWFILVNLFVSDLDRLVFLSFQN
jgi:hypothetical protein